MNKEQQFIAEYAQRAFQDAWLKLSAVLIGFAAMLFFVTHSYGATYHG